MLNKLRSPRLLYAIVSIFFSLILFFTASYNQYNQAGTQISRVTETYTHTLTEVPIDIKYDSDRYFISGYSYETKVYLTSTNRVKLDSEINSDTRKFKVVADLKDIETGTVKVPLQIKDLPDEMTATATPSKITVTVGKKKSKTFSVVGEVSDDQIAEGYALKSISTDIKEVTVTSDEATIDQIDHVVARIDSQSPLSENYSKKVTLQAVAANGTILPSIIDPAKAKLSVLVEKLTKEVPVSLDLTGQMDSSLSDIYYELSTPTVTISANQDILDQITSIPATLDISDVTKDTVKKVKLEMENVTISPSEIDVKLITKKK